MAISYENLLDNRKQPIKKNAFVNIKTKSTTCNEQTKKMDKEGNKTVGIAKVPTFDFIGGFLSEDYLHFLSYGLRNEKGEKNGLISFFVMVKNAHHRVAVEGGASGYDK
ncbi:BON1-associated protein 2 [Capsicum baccatum]|uniref:BON1-associated protein 2 n=1 Tax=Capsicum baccatum TaxID=33114 RepID=A0A2G2X7L9_CAPBA|nr:BON1-associated protein 2 [Capsicum baccatum]